MRVRMGLRHPPPPDQVLFHLLGVGGRNCQGEIRLGQRERYDGRDFCLILNGYDQAFQGLSEVSGSVLKHDVVLL